MKISICLFEDENYSNLLPLVYLRPVYDLRCGILTLREKIESRFNGMEITLHSRNYLENVLRERCPNNKVNNFLMTKMLFINGRIIINDKLMKLITKLDLNCLLKNGENIIAALLDAGNIKRIISHSTDRFDFEAVKELPTTEIDATLIAYPWDLVNLNGEEIINDYKLLTKKRKSDFPKFKAVEIANKKNVFVSRGVKIDPYVFLDASAGPIFLGKNVRIMSHSSVQGPCFIGNNSTIKMHASIYHNTSIGEACKVGGEVESSIIHSYSNKQHEGFLGHSYLGSWVNIGASTNNSDLKNNYSSVDVVVNGKQINSGSQFVGLIMGDHSKTAINVMFNTGTNVGISCNIFGSGFPPKYIPSFCWGGSDFLRTYNLNKSCEVAELVMKRRSVKFTNAEKELIEAVFNFTEQERTAKNIH